MSEDGLIVNDAMARETEFIPGYGEVYTDTGELVDIPLDSPEKIRKAFHFGEAVEFSEEEVEWGLRKLFRLDGDIVAAESRLKAEMDAVSKNWKPEIGKRNRAKEGFLRWFSPYAKQYAERQLLIRNTKRDGTLKANPEKSVKFPNGSLAFRASRSTPASVQVRPGVSESQLLEYMKEHFPAYVEMVPKVNLSKFTVEDLKEIGDLSPVLEVLPEVASSDEFSVKTGVK